MKKLLAVLIGLIIAAGVVFGVGFILFRTLNSPADETGRESSRFIVEPGESLQTVSFHLQQGDFIRSQQFFRLYAKMKDQERDIKAGVYEIPAKSTVIEILDILVEGKQQLRKVTIPEGQTVHKIAAILDENNIVSMDDFIQTAGREDIIRELKVPSNTLEGFLFPDTYFFPEEYNSEKVIEALVNNFYTHLDTIYPQWTELKDKDLADKVILASIIEREYRVAREAPLIASVFYNRLSKNIGLNSCATIEYIITEIEGKEHPEYLTYNDLEIDSPFNTYKWAGLPPAPISSPGAVALKASFYPEETDYYYFVLKDPAVGEHQFTKSNDEHIEAKRLYLKD